MHGVHPVVRMTTSPSSRSASPGSSVPVEDVTGAEQLGTGAPATRELAQVIGYPNATNQPITCQNWVKEPMKDQLEFDCGGYTDGTSGGPFLSKVDPSTGQGMVIGVIGGYEQGGIRPRSRTRPCSAPTPPPSTGRRRPTGRSGVSTTPASGRHTVRRAGPAAGRCGQSRRVRRRPGSNRRRPHWP